MKLSKKIKQLCIEESKSFFLVKHPDRVKLLGEVFTPTELVLEMLEQLPDDMWEPGKTFLDPSCGNGQFLAAAAIIKRELGHENPLASIYGVDIMEDNIAETQERLLEISNEPVAVQQNIVCADALRYHYRFDGTPPYQTEQDQLIESLFDFN
jgi:SAM-dependent methyltransferase